MLFPSLDLGKANLKEEEEDFRDDDTSSKDEGAVVRKQIFSQW